MNMPWYETLTILGICVILIVVAAASLGNNGSDEESVEVKDEEHI